MFTKTSAFIASPCHKSACAYFLTGLCILYTVYMKTSIINIAPVKHPPKKLIISCMMRPRDHQFWPQAIAAHWAYRVSLVSLAVKMWDSHKSQYAASISLYDRKLNLHPYIRGVTNWENIRGDKRTRHLCGDKHSHSRPSVVYCTVSRTMKLLVTVSGADVGRRRHYAHCVASGRPVQMNAFILSTAIARTAPLAPM